MAERKRKIEYKIFVDEEENKIIEQKMQALGITNKSAYARKMMIDGLIIKTDYSAIKELSMQISKVGNNINQIARQVNEMQNISKEQVQELRNFINIISTNQQETMKILMTGLEK